MQPQEAIDPKDFDFLLNHYTQKPEEFITDVLGAVCWEKQVEIIRSTFQYKYTAVKTCNAIGKSFIAARIVVTYLMLYPSSIVVTTAPTWRQVTDVLWREIGTAVKKSKYKLTDKEATQAGLSLDTDWFAVGLSTKRPENFFGYHAKNILVVVDEAGGVEEPIFKGVAAITPNADARVLLIGNPTSPSGTFYNAFTKPELGYNCITVSAFDTPNFIDTNIRNVNTLLKIFTAPAGYSQAEWIRGVNEELEKRMNPTFSGLIAPSVVFSRYHEWGPDSPAWESLIMGEFPTQAEQSLLPVNLVTMAMNMYGTDKDSGLSNAEISGWKITTGQRAIGQDMARFGMDRCVLTPRDGGWVDKQVTWSKLDLMESANRIIDCIDVNDPDLIINIDDTGNGGGTTDRLNEKIRESQNGGHNVGYMFRVNAYNFSSKDFMTDEDREQFHDITSMLYWNLRKQFVQRKIALHYDQELFDELVSRRWFINKSGKIQVESKDDYKKRTGGKSPDKSDSLALAFAPNNVGTWIDQKPVENSEINKRPVVLTQGATFEQRVRSTVTGGMLDERY